VKARVADGAVLSGGAMSDDIFALALRALGTGAWDAVQEWRRFGAKRLLVAAICAWNGRDMGMLGSARLWSMSFVGCW